MSESTSNGSKKILYRYNESGSIAWFEYNGSKYYYKKNLQGDIIGILDTSFNEVAKYAYDAWGKPTYIKDGRLGSAHQYLYGLRRMTWKDHLKKS